MFTETYGYHSSGPAGSPGMGQYVPTADLNASKKKKKLKESPLKMKYDDAIDVVFDKIRENIKKDLEMGKIDSLNKLAKSVRMKVSDVENKPGRHMVTLNQEFTMEEREDTTTEE
jgi:hypothetical protein